MATFNFQRFQNFLRWDLTYNKKFYWGAAKMILFSFLAITMIVVLFTTNVISKNSYSEYITHTLAASFTGIGIIFFIIMFGYTLKNLSTKQGRTFEMSIPATNIEKFTAHYLTTLIGVPGLIIVSIIICDVICATLSLTYFQDSATHSIIKQMIDDFLREKWDDNLATVFIIHFTALTYTFVNTFKYNHNIPITLAIQVFGLILLAIFSNNSQTVQHIESSDWVTLTILPLMNIGLWIGTLYRFGRCQLIK